MKEKDIKFCRIKNAISWRIDQDGILRCTAAVMRSCVMQYNIYELEEDNDVPEFGDYKDIIFQYAPPDEVSNPDSLKSLEGIQLTRDCHSWQCAGEVESIGQTAGAPRYDETTGLLFSDLVITDPETIQRIIVEGHDQRLIELSAAYRMEIDWIAGLSPSGEKYDGVQRNIRYNHITLLTEGSGRAGKMVKIYNSKGVKNMEASSYVRMKIGSSHIRVMNEDADALQREVDTKDDKIKNQIDGSQLEEAMTRLNDLNDQMSVMTKEKDELTGQLQQVQDQLAQATNPDTMSSAIDDAIEEQADADDITDSLGADEEDIAANTGDPSDRDNKTLNSKNTKRLFGHALRLKVVNSIRVLNKNSELSEDQAKNKDIVRGMFMALRDSAKMMKNNINKTVNGSKLVKVLNSKKDTGVKTINMMSASERLDAIYSSSKKSKGSDK